MLKYWKYKFYVFNTTTIVHTLARAGSFFYNDFTEYNFWQVPLFIIQPCPIKKLYNYNYKNLLVKNINSTLSKVS